jgi:hypothetical protein
MSPTDRVLSGLEARSAARPWPRIQGPSYQALVWLVLTLALALGQALHLSLREPMLALPLDGRAAPLLLHGFHKPERDARGVYRWTAGPSELLIAPLGDGAPLALHLTVGAPPSRQTGAAQLSIEGRLRAQLPPSHQPRHLTLLVPQAALADDALSVSLGSAATLVPPDRRLIGVRLEAVDVEALGAWVAWPAPSVLGAQALLLACAAVAIARLRQPRIGETTALALVALALFAAAQAQPLLADIYLARLAVAGALLAAATVWLLPWAEQRLAGVLPAWCVRAIWGVTLFACGLRLAGALYPPFEAYDLATYHLPRLERVATGTLVLTNRSLEFRNGVIVNPPALYLALLPGLLLGLSPQLALQGGIALLDGLGAAAAAALTRGLGASPRAALLAALLYAAAPVALTAHWYGLSTQVVGQALVMPLALALLCCFHAPQARWPWAWAVLLLALVLLTHIGVTILALAWLGLAWLPLRRALAPLAWRRLTLALLLGGALALLLIYADVALLKLREAAVVGQDLASEGYTPSYALIWRGWQIAFTPLALLLAALGLGLLPLRRGLARGGAALLAGWLGATALFGIVELLSGLQVRYIYFVLPLACLLAALLLDALARRGRWGLRLAYAAALLVVAQGAALWLFSVFSGESPSMVALLR